MTDPAPEKVAARAAELHEEVEAALTLARDPFTRRELVHAAIDRALAGYDVMEEGHRLRAALRTLANEAALLAWRDDLIEDGTDPALNAAGCDVARIEEGERPCQHFENFERFKDWMTASERAAVSAVLYFASIESEQEYADRKAAALSDEARP